MKRICKTALALGLSLLLGNALFAQSLNVFTDNPDAKIYVDEELIGYRLAKGVKVEKGSHLVRVEVGKRTVFSEVVTIEDNSVKTINVDRFVGVESPVPNRGAMTTEAKRALEGRGNIALGLNGSYMPGISVKTYLTPKIGLQGTGWFFSMDGTKYSSWEMRAHYNIINTLINRMPGSLYVASGIGQKNTSQDEQEYFDVALGLEVSLRTGSGNTQVLIHDRESLFAALLSSLLFLDNAYISGELGYGSIESDDGAPSYQGMLGRIGIHYYF